MSKNRNERIVSATLVVIITLGVLVAATRDEVPSAVRGIAATPVCPACRELVDLRKELDQIVRSSQVKRRAKMEDLELAEAAVLRKAGIRIGRFFRTDAGQVRDATEEETKAAVEFYVAVMERDTTNIVLDAMAETLGSAMDLALSKMLREITTLKDQSVVAAPDAAAARMAIAAFSSEGEGE